MARPGLIGNAAALAGLLSGCTTQLEVRPLDQTSTAPIRGLVYNLPFTQYEVTITRTLTKCPGMEGQKAAPLTFKTDVMLVTGAAQPDPDQEYQIDLRGLSSAWKTSDLKVTMKGTILTQFNATVVDQTGAVISNVTSTAAGIASSIVTGGFAPRAPNAQGVAPRLVLTCTDEANQALDDLAGTNGAPGLNAQLKTATAKLSADTARLKTLTGASTSMGNSVDPSIQREVFDAAKLIADDTDAMAPIQAKVIKAQSVITTSTTVRWPTSGALSGTDPSFPFQRLPLPGGPETVNGWLKHAETATQTPDGADMVDKVDDQFFVLAIQLQRLPSSERVPVTASIQIPTNPRDIARQGLRYRTSARAQLILCTAVPASIQTTGGGGGGTTTRTDGTAGGAGSATGTTGTTAGNGGVKPPDIGSWPNMTGGPPPSPNGQPRAPQTPRGRVTAPAVDTATATDSSFMEAVGTTKPCPAIDATDSYFGATSLSIWEGSAPQLGRIQFLPYKNGPFQSNVLSATFNDDGTLATAEYQEPTSRAAAITGSLLAATNSGTALVKTIVTAPTTKLKAEDDELSAQASVIKAKAAATTAKETALAQANTDLALALKAEADAQAALAKTSTPQ